MRVTICERLRIGSYFPAPLKCSETARAFLKTRPNSGQPTLPFTQPCKRKSCSTMRARVGGAVHAQRQLLRRPPATTEMAAEDVDPEESILILKRRSLNVMAANQPESVIAGLATRRTTTLLSSAGGTGKTCLLTQAAIESSQDRPVWGNAEFHSNGPRRWLYMNAEDSLQSIDYWLARILARYDLQECPVDIMPVCETKTGEFLFSSDNAQSLARRINAERYDGLIIDTGIAVMTPGTRFIDPLSIRGWLRSSVGILQRETQAAIIVAVHDRKGSQCRVRQTGCRSRGWHCIWRPPARVAARPR